MTPTEADGERTEFAIDDNLGYLVNQAARLIRQMFSRRLRPHGVQVGQWAILQFLYFQDGQTQADLSRLVAIEPPTAARTLDRMERDGLVRREPHPIDSRASSVRLTQRAIALQDELVTAAIQGNVRAARGLTPQELETLKSLLRRVIAGLHEDVE